MPHTRILIAEDTDFFRTMLSDSLTERGLEVVTAKDGLEAMEIINREHASLGLLVLDLVMPNKDGEQVLRELKANQETKHLPVLVLTGAKFPPEKRVLLHSLGAAGFWPNRRALIKFYPASYGSWRSVIAQTELLLREWT